MIRDINLDTVTLWPLICDSELRIHSHNSALNLTDTQVSKTDQFSSWASEHQL